VPHREPTGAPWARVGRACVASDVQVVPGKAEDGVGLVFSSADEKTAGAAEMPSQ
jgi:hypothetical protein